MSNRIKIKAKFGVRGEIRAILRNLDGSIISDTGWTPNLFTDLGLGNMVDGGNWGPYWCLGSGSTPPQASDVNMSAFIKNITDSTGQISPVKTNSGAPDYILTETWSKRWSEGPGESGVVAEFGKCQDTLGNGTDIHTLVNPPINKNDDQVLDFYHRMTATPDLTETTGQVTITDQSGTPQLYNYTAKFANIDSAQANISSSWIEFTSFGGHTLYDGNFGATITDIPSGASDIATENPIKISSGVGVRQYQVEFGVDSSNFPTGIRSGYSRWNTLANAGIQWEISRASDGAALIKTDDQKVLVDMVIEVVAL